MPSFVFTGRDIPYLSSTSCQLPLPKDPFLSSPDVRSQAGQLEREKLIKNSSGYCKKTKNKE